MLLPAFNINKLFLRVRMHAYAVVVVVYILYFRGGNPKKWGVFTEEMGIYAEEMLISAEEIRRNTPFLLHKSEDIGISAEEIRRNKRSF